MSRLLLSSLLALGVGCAGTGSAVRSEPSTLHLGQREVASLQVVDTSVQGPFSSLRLAGNSMNGRFQDQPTHLTWTYQKLTGLVGMQGTHLELAEGDDTRIWGSFGGVPVDITDKGTWLYGRVGLCNYILARVEEGYSGMRRCGGMEDSDSELAFPESLLARPLGEKAALMTLMFVHDTASYSSVRTIRRAAAANRVTLRNRNSPWALLQ